MLDPLADSSPAITAGSSVRFGSVPRQCDCLQSLSGARPIGIGPRHGAGNLRAVELKEFTPARAAELIAVHSGFWPSGGQHVGTQNWYLERRIPPGIVVSHLHVWPDAGLYPRERAHGASGGSPSWGGGVAVHVLCAQPSGRVSNLAVPGWQT